MRKISHRSHANCNNIGQYNASDRKIDGQERPQGDIMLIIRHCDDVRPNTTPTPSPKPHARPLRHRLGESKTASNGIKIRVYSDGVGKQLLGLALSATSLLSLIEAGYLDADRVEIKGSIDGVPVNTTIDEHQFDDFKTSIAV